MRTAVELQDDWEASVCEVGDLVLYGECLELNYVFDLALVANSDTDRTFDDEQRRTAHTTVDLLALSRLSLA